MEVLREELQPILRDITNDYITFSWHVMSWHHRQVSPFKFTHLIIAGAFVQETTVCVLSGMSDLLPHYQLQSLLKFKFT